MPRKQRFKPSRKPKPVEPAHDTRTETNAPSYNPDSEPTRPYPSDAQDPERNHPARTQAVIED